MWSQNGTCVWSTFAPRDDKTKWPIWRPDELQKKGSIRESLSDPAHWTHNSGGKYIFNTQGPVKLQLRAVGAVTAVMYL